MRNGYYLAVETSQAILVENGMQWPQGKIATRLNRFCALTQPSVASRDQAVLVGGLHPAGWRTVRPDVVMLDARGPAITAQLSVGNRPPGLGRIEVYGTGKRTRRDK